MRKFNQTRWLHGRSLSAVVALLFASAVPSVVDAQDSVTVAVQRYEAHRAATVACARFPLVWEAHGPSGDSQLHRDPVTGRDCWVLPGPPGPVAYRVDDVLYCPSAQPSRWGSWPTGARAIAPAKILATTMTRDSTALKRLSCAIVPVALLSITTTGASRAGPPQ